MDYMIKQKNNLGNQTENMKQALVCHIRDLHLKPGDRLPTQAELRRKFGVGATTIQRAVDSLAKAGIVEIRPHKGVILKKMETNGFVGREIGLVCIRSEYSPYFALVMESLQMCLHESACQCKLFLRDYHDMTDLDSLSYFDGLQRCIEQNEIQGILTLVSFDDPAWELIRKHNIPVVSLASASRNEGYKVVNALPAEDLFKLAHARGFKRPAWIQCGYPQAEQIYKEFVENCPLPPEKYLHLIRETIVVEDAPPNWGKELKEVLQKILALPEKELPDVVIIPDDFIVSDFQRILLQARLKGVKWDPHFIYITHRQLPIFLPEDIPGDYFEHDFMVQAKAAVDLLLDLIRGKKNIPEIVCVKPELHLIEEGKEEK